MILIYLQVVMHRKVMVKILDLFALNGRLSWKHRSLV